MDTPIKFILFVSYFLISLFCTFLVINANNYIIIKSQWNCTKSLMTDPKNVDKVICVNYHKVTEEE